MRGTEEEEERKGEWYNMKNEALTTNFAAVGVLCSHTGSSSRALSVRVPTDIVRWLGQSGTQGTLPVMLAIVVV